MSDIKPKFGFKEPGFKDIGNMESICPTCNKALEKRPTRKSKCPHCGNYIYVRTRPSDRKKVLLSEAQTKELDVQWEKYHGTNNNQLKDTAEFQKVKINLTKQYGQEPSDAAVYWVILGMRATKEAEVMNWGLYRNTRSYMADLLRSQGEKADALSLYIEVSYLDANGPENVGGYQNCPELLEKYPQFDPSRARQAPGVVGQIDDLARVIGLDEVALWNEYLGVASGIQSSLNTPASAEVAWAAYKSELDEVKKVAEEADRVRRNSSLRLKERPAESLLEASREVSRLAANLQIPDQSTLQRPPEIPPHQASKIVKLNEEQEKREVPEFKRYYSKPSMMNKKQKAFYDYLVSEIIQGRFPSVDGNISYLFAYAYSHIISWRKKGYAAVYDELTRLAAAYSYEESFYRYVMHWAGDCLLAQGKYEEFLEATAPTDLLGLRRGYRIERWSVFKLIGGSLPLLDFLSLTGWKTRAGLTKYTLDNLARYWVWLEALYSDEAVENGPWLERLLEMLPEREPRKLSIFSGVAMSQPLLDIPVYNFTPLYQHVLYESSRLSRIAEDRLRVHDQVPRVGEGWVSETALYWTVKAAFSQTRVIQHGKPNWLGQQHLDIWMPDWGIAVEYHGRQHFEPVEFFGGEGQFAETVRRDKRKMELCKENGVELLIATKDDGFDEVLNRIRSIHKSGTS